jgi:hypothetical protein
MYDVFNINNNKKFIHFDSEEQCNQFIRLFGRTHVKSICCSGKGFGYINSSENNRIIRELQANLLRCNTRIEHTVYIPSPVFKIDMSNNELDKECCVCLIENQEYTACSHNLCRTCNAKLERRNCPICRKKI